jgi:protein-arginine kinase
MALIDELAEKLALDTMKAMEETGNDRLWIDVGNFIGTSSPSLQESFNTACRSFLAERRGRQFLEDQIARLKAKQAKAEG